MADRDLLEIVWDETCNLRPKDDSAAALARLHVAVAKIAGAATKRGIAGYLQRRTAPDAEDARLSEYLTMKTTGAAV